MCVLGLVALAWWVTASHMASATNCGGYKIDYALELYLAAKRHKIRNLSSRRGP